MAIQYAGLKHGLTHAIILDFDLHHGDGSQDIVWKLSGLESHEEEFEACEDENEKSSPKVGYFSLHDVNSFPTEVGYATAENIKNASVCLMAHDLAVWNVHLEPYSTSEEFDTLYANRYSDLFRKAEQFLSTAKTAATISKTPFKSGVFLSAGFDASEFEDKGMQRHGVHVPTSFYARFTDDSVALANKYCDGRVLSLLEGGYSDAALCSGVMSHLIGLQSGLSAWQDEFASTSVVRQLERGCKPRWNAPKSAVAKDNWIVKAIELGRSMRPDGGIAEDGFSTPGSSAMNSPVKGTPMTTTRTLRERRTTPAHKGFATPSGTARKKAAMPPVPNLDRPDVMETPVGRTKIVKEDGTWKIIDRFDKLSME